jgi:hypothetical protein
MVRVGADGGTTWPAQTLSEDSTRKTCRLS